MTPIYMDNHATTPVDPEILEVFLQTTRDYPGNPASIDHLHGAEALRRLEEARAEAAEALDAQPREVIFTSGSTESNNIALNGIHAVDSRRKGIITSRGEHSSVFEVCRQLADNGWSVTYVPVNQDGGVTPHALSEVISEKTALVSLAAANHEVGTVNDVAALSRIVHKNGALFHCDATQAICSVGIRFEADGLDLMSISGHKIYAPRGSGALVVRKSGPRVHLRPLLMGGGQERGIRPGTVNVAGAAALAAALSKVVRERDKQNERLAGLRDKMWELLREGVDGSERNGQTDRHLPGNLSVYIPGVEAKALVAAVRNVVSVSTGSACSTGSVEPSRVLLSMGQSPQRAHETVRIGIGRFNTHDDVLVAADALIAQANNLRSLAQM